ncbi:MAG: hypothetical protein ABJ370_16060 [Paracoccaceae bacterium]
MTHLDVPSSPAVIALRASGMTTKAAIGASAANGCIVRIADFGTALPNVRFKSDLRDV